MEERLLYVVYTFDNMGGWGVGSVLLENTKAPNFIEDYRSLNGSEESLIIIIFLCQFQESTKITSSNFLLTFNGG